MRRRRIAAGRPRALAFGLALAAATCCGDRPPAVRPGPAPTAEQLLSVLATRQTLLRSMNARTRATSWIGGERLRATVLLLVARRGALRIEAEVSLQGTVSILTTQAGRDADSDADADGTKTSARFQLLDVRNNRLQQGPACPENVASLIRIPLAPDEVAAILLGDAKLPRAIAASDASVAWDAIRGADALVVKDGAVERRVLFAPDSRRGEILGASASTAAGPLWRTSYEDFADVGSGLRLPSLIRFAERGASFDDGVEIKFKDRTVNPDPRAESFVITPPAGTEVVEVGCGPGGPGGAPAGP
ncbi:MAG TPA: hypothetical protein VFH68_24280 [Polyangia bacterium]|nr:hypothetical protein [Polyangia bacterium]